MAKAATTVSGALRQPAEHHAAGRLEDAERLCDAVLDALPEHAEALHRRGVLAFQRGAFDRNRGKSPGAQVSARCRIRSGKGGIEGASGTLRRLPR